MDESQIMFHQDLISTDETLRQQRIERTVRVTEAVGNCGAPAVSVLIGEDTSEGNAWAQAIDALEPFATAPPDTNILTGGDRNCYERRRDQ